MTSIDGEHAKRIRDNLARVRESIAAAAARAGRPAGSVKLVGVTKYVGPETARLLVEAGLKDLGESRPQQLWEKAEALADLPVRWHLIGHLQRNKVKRTLPVVTLIHSADTLRLLNETSTEAAELGRSASVLLEINVSGDAAKHGFQSVELERLLPQVALLGNLQVLGLMTMASLDGGETVTRRNFAELRGICERLKPNCPPNVTLAELSMGMSGDYEIAIEEGATIVRVGSALFEGVED